MAKIAADEAYELAVKEIERVRGLGEIDLHLNSEKLRALNRLPDEISTLTWLETIHINGTAVTDLTPVSGLTTL